MSDSQPGSGDTLDEALSSRLSSLALPGVARTPITKNGHRSSAAWVGASLEVALRARAPHLQASTQMLRPLAVKASRAIGLDNQAHALLDIAVGVRDIGMLALPDSLILATAPLSPADWELVNRHPVIGEQLLEELFVVAAAAGIVRAHHERWDGGGYPDGLRGDAIPLISRVIATCDAFVAIATDRPHRRGIGAEAALEHVCLQSGSRFDPRTVDALVSALTGDGERRQATEVSANAGSVARHGSAVRKTRDRGDLTRAIEEFDVIPAFAPAHERVVTATATDDIPEAILWRRSRATPV